MHSEQPELIEARSGSTEIAIFTDDLSNAVVPSGWADTVVRQWCNEQVTLDGLDDARDNLETSIHHLRKKRLNYLELQKAQRYVEIRIGELLKPYTLKDKKSHPKLPGGEQADYEFTRMARYKDEVREWIEKDGIVARQALLRKITEKEAASSGIPLFDLPATYQVIYVDPPWRYDHTETPDVRQIENQYTTMTMEELEKMVIPAAPHAVMLMWATNPKLKDALHLMEVWGFSYRTNMVWTKNQMGMGYYVRGAHEILLIGKKGNLSMPPTSARPISWLNSPRQAHSVKPDYFMDRIEAMYPDCSKLEMFARHNRPGWTAWGHEITDDIKEI